MKHWILKTEPETYSFNDLVRDGKTRWDGVRNYLARNNLRAMKVGDLAVIYESVGPKAAVGTAIIAKAAYPDPLTQEDWSAVDVSAGKSFAKPVTLVEMKADKLLKNISLVKNSRLSVCPLSLEEYQRLIKLGGL